ncbi:unnamed protein product [Lupinus luteus]|uniref:Uncharacterized protein n=1 Tax=Lupinus luteus TaxID=3873 RepID=A0AAV1XDE5_LUPLU
MERDIEEKERLMVEKREDTAQSKQLHLQDKKSVDNAEENWTKEKDDIIKYFLENSKHVAQSYGHDIIKENAFVLVKYPGKEKDNDDNMNVDPQYKSFMGKLRPDGKSYVLDIIEETISVKYEPPIPELEALTACAIENANHVSNASPVVDKKMHTHTKCKGKHRGRKPKDLILNADRHGIGSGSHVASDTKKRAGSHRHRKQKGIELSADKNPNDSVSNMIVASKPQNQAPSYKGKRRGRKPKGCAEHHAIKNSNGNSNHVVSEAHKHDHDSKRASKRAKENVVPSAVETACLSQTRSQTIDHGIKEEPEYYDDDNPCIRRPMQVSVLNVEIFCHNDDDEANARKSTEYREKLMEELKKPYCSEEYERLLNDITVRKPAQGHKVLRGCTKIYKEDYDAKSYLDHHIDLKKKIDSARDDHPKILNLLRGFFYWLVNSSHERSFRPWRVQSCLDVLPQ